MENAKNVNRVLMGVIILLCVVAFGNSFNNEFAYDDNTFILNNLEIRSLSNIPSFFFQDTEGLYRPLRQTWYTIMYAFAGNDPFLYHINSLILHILISLLIFNIARKLISQKVAFFSALVFAVHPIHTERVTNMTGGFDLIGILFLFLAFYAYINFVKKPEFVWKVISILCFILGLFSSEEAIVLIFIIPLYDGVYNTIDKKKLQSYIPYAIITIGYLLIRFIFLDIGARGSYADTPFLASSMIVVFAKYVGLLIHPYPLTALQQIVPLTDALQVKVILSAVLLIGLIAVAIKSKPSKKLIAFSIGWFFLTVLPFSNIVPLQTLLAERYLYVASFGFALLIPYIIYKGKNLLPNIPIKPYIAPLLLTIIILSFTTLTINRNADWKNDVRLWSAEIQTNPQSSKAYDNLGFALERTQQLQPAVYAFSKSVELDPHNFKALANLGVVYYKLEKYELATKALNFSIQLNPNYAKAYNHLGLAYKQLQQPNVAIAHYLRAIAIDPQQYEAYNNLGVVYAQYKEPEKAREMFQQALLINPQYQEAQFNLDLVT